MPTNWRSSSTTRMLLNVSRTAGPRAPAGGGTRRPPRHRGGLFERGGDRRAQIKARAAQRELRTIGPDAGEDAVDEMIETLDLRCRLRDRHLRLAIFVGEQVEVTADDRERRP